MYLEGIGIEKDEDKGLKLIEKAANLNETNAISLLANYNSMIKKDPIKTKSLLIKLAEERNLFAIDSLKLNENEEKIIERMIKFVDLERPKVNLIEYKFTDEENDTLLPKEKEEIIKKFRESEIFKRIEKNQAKLLFGDKQEEAVENYVKNLKSIMQSKENAKKELKEFGFDIDVEKENEIFEKYFS